MGGKPCDKLLYSQIIKEVNKILAEKLLEGHTIEFPYQMGKLMLASLPTRVFYKDGELRTNYRTDWKKTLDLWYEDEEMLNTHKPIKKIHQKIYFIKYYRTDAKFPNKRFYKFRTNRGLARELGRMIDAGKVIAEPLSYD